MASQHIALAFETDDGSRILRERVHTDINSQTRSESLDIELYYDIIRCVDLIREKKYQEIALQFPDSLLADAYSVQKAIKTHLDRQNITFKRVFILGDTSYGSCCVDEIAAKHLFADVVIHYGSSCLSPTSSVPVIWVFGLYIIDVAHCVNSFYTYFIDKSSEPNAFADNQEATHALLLFDPMYLRVMDKVQERLSERLAELNIQVHLGKLRDFYDPKHKTEETENRICIGSHELILPADVWPSEQCGDHLSVLYIGGESAHLTSILVRLRSHNCFSYDPKRRAVRKEGVGINKLLMRRFFLLQKAKEARILGILMGTLGVAEYLEIVKQLQKLIQRSGRKSYLFVVGKVNLAKLANFDIVDAFVIVACRQNLFLDSKEYVKPIVTPYELLLALTNTDDAWAADYKNDFWDLIPLLSVANCQSVDQKANEPFYSLVSGTYQSFPSTFDDYQPNPSLQCDESNCYAIQPKDSRTELVKYQSLAGKFLAAKEYQGLDPRLGQTSAHAAVPGSTGIASRYNHEREEQLDN